jgi:hypothetical protein
MVKTQNRKNKKNRKKNKKTKKVHGGEPTVITVQGLYDNHDKELVAYYILHNKMNDEQKQQYADKHKVFIPSDESFFGKIFDTNPKRLKKLVDKYFYPGKNKVKISKHPPFKSIAIHDTQDIKQIEIANQIIENINSQTFSNEPTTKYDGSAKNIMTIIKEYKNFMNDVDNENKILDKVTDIKEGKQMLRSPVFLKTIGEKYGIFSNSSPNNWSDMVKTEGGLDKIFEMLK